MSEPATHIDNAIDDMTSENPSPRGKRAMERLAADVERAGQKQPSDPYQVRFSEPLDEFLVMYVPHNDAVIRYHKSMKQDALDQCEMLNAAHARSAAPDLLAACERVMQLQVAWNSDDEVFTQVRAAIAKAKGGAS